MDVTSTVEKRYQNVQVAATLRGAEAMSHHSVYDDEATIARMAAEGQHRKIIGGLWDEIGQLQFDYLRENGLTPQSRLLDIGCGSLRLGAKAVAYLESATTGARTSTRAC